MPLLSEQDVWTAQSHIFFDQAILGLSQTDRWPYGMEGRRLRPPPGKMDAHLL